MPHISGAEALNDQEEEGLVPNGRAVLGLKVADDTEAETVRRVGGALFGIVAILVLHCLVHISQNGNVLHAFWHLFTSLMLPVVGFVAVSQRSTTAAWGFHVMAALTVVVHVAGFAAMVQAVFDQQAEHYAHTCPEFAGPCKGNTQKLQRNHLSPSGLTWRCGHGACTEGTARCDGHFNCFDRSDEIGCKEEFSWYEEKKEARRCHQITRKLQSAPHLTVWWTFMTGPLICLCAYAAYHSLEFFVQLRLQSLSARVNRSSGQAVVFDRADPTNAVAE